MDESDGKTVPYRPWKSRILERVRGEGEGVKIGTAKGGGGGNSTVFMPATLWFQQKKKSGS